MVELPDGWGYGPEVRPPRSALTAPEPIGIGTAVVEAFTSFVARVAAEHELPPGLFARYVLASRLGRDDIPGSSIDEWGRYFEAIFGSAGHSLDGVGRLAATWVSVFEQMTGRGWLAGMTSLRWAPVLAPMGLTSDRLRVCVSCLRLMPIAYEPLTWRYKPLEACFEHDVPMRLVQGCPSCAAVSPVLGTWRLQGAAGRAAPRSPRRPSNPSRAAPRTSSGSGTSPSS